jgi:L-lactate dehydrogenase
MVHVAGMQIDKYCPMCGRCADWSAERGQIEQDVRDSAYHIIEYKGATNFAIGLALVQITGAILRGQRSVLTVSTMLDGEFGLRDVCLSVPSIVSDGGVVKIIENQLPESELAALTASASTLKKAMEQLDPNA